MKTKTPFIANRFVANHLYRNFITSFLHFLITSSLVAQIPSYVPTNGLVGYWPFNGNANDESGNGNNGTVNGATLTADRNGNANSAYSFDGVDDFIQGNFNNFPLGGNSRSISAWVDFSTTNDDFINFIASWGLGTSSQSSAHQAFGLCICSNLNCLNIWQSFSDTEQNETFSTNFATNFDYHIASTVDAQGNFQFYINGALVYSSVTLGLNTIANGNVFRIGRSTHTNTDGWAGFFKGNLDDIAIYNRALTQEEITALYNGTTTSGGGGNGGTAGTPAPIVPQGIPYQAMIRDNNGAALINNPVTVRFSLRQDAIDGTVEYQETHNLTTNAFGLINAHFGTGTATQGTFANINWSNTTKFIQVEANTGGGFVEMGTQQMMSVPFALKANESTKVKNAGLPVFANNAAALAGGLVAGDMYRTATGDLKIVY